ncbi:MAG TPA: biotin-dependent carboxyltransferase family protein [Marmoricola sp.]|jgi:biotin-dependent carboxylase-like uncharacterized protein|nr:biotin-dependent carboxyltransferase family protein [Marmoricola sp.]
MNSAVDLVVLDPGALTTIQDLGRPGHAHLGVPRSGALDVPALRLANRLVGNPEGAPALETTLTGVRLGLRRGCRFAVSGAPCTVQVDGREQPWGSAVSAGAGAVVQIGPAVTALRSYVAFAGGILGERVLGSASTDLLSGLGPRPLTAGDELRLGTPYAEPPDVTAMPTSLAGVLHLDLGPRADWFATATLAALDGATYEVGGASNRIGLRLVGPALERRRDAGLPAELPTEPMVLGAVQVPPSGQPVVFLADHPTTGGYPVIGVVRGADLPVCAQARPGDRLTLRLAGAARAEPGRRQQS